MNDTDIREEYVSSIIRQLVGPSAGEEEWLPRADPPHKRYIAAVLYPRVEGTSDPSEAAASDIEEEAGTVIADADEPDDSPLADMLQRSPASAGMTFAVSPEAEVQIEARAGRYEESRLEEQGGSASSGPEGFKRRPLSEVAIVLSDAISGDSRHEIFQEEDGALATLRVRWRVIEACRVVTVSIVNNSEIPEDERPDALACLYQVGLDASCLKGSFVEPPGPTLAAQSRVIHTSPRASVQFGVACSSMVCNPAGPNPLQKNRWRSLQISTAVIYSRPSSPSSTPRLSLSQLFG